jgi:CheY-like chemotaxis protein
MHTLLLADDSVTIQRVLALSFVGQPFEVVIAKDGQDAIDRMATVRPDLVLADTNMPCVDGYGVAEWMRQQPHLEGVPVLLLASALDPLDEQRFRMSGAAGVLEKPFEPTHVIDRVKELLGLKPAPDGDDTRLVTPPIKVIRPPDKTEPAPEVRPGDTPSSPVPAPAVPEPASPVHAVLSSLQAEISGREGSGSHSVAPAGDKPLAPPLDAAADRTPSAQPPMADSATGGQDDKPGSGASVLAADPDPSDARPADVFESLLAAELSTGDGPGGQTASAPHDPVGAKLGTAEGFQPAAGVSREMWDDLAARLEARLGLPDVRNELQHSMTIAVNDAVARALRESVASEVAAALRELQPALEQAVRESIASALPVAVAQATDGVRQEVQSHVASAVAAAMPAAMAEAAAGALGESVRGIVLETSERLVKEEIARVRGK